jgi:nitrate/nitrite transport system ATP-binding protein
MNPFIRIENLTKEFTIGKQKTVAVRDVNLNVRQGEFIAFIGHSGCGKSTVLSMIAGLVQPTAGQVMIEGRIVKGPGWDRAMVFQNYSLLPWLTVRQNVYEAVASVYEQNMAAKDKERLTEDALKMVNLWQHKDKKPAQLSGGMKQRVAIARAFAIEPDVLLLDEPFGALDALTKGTMHEELLRMWRTNKRRQTVFMVTHDMDEAIFLADRIVVMTNGPAATIGEVLDVDIERPRDKRQVLHHPRYAAIKERLMELLEESHFALPKAA